MRPYYDRDGITLYLGRWEDVLPALPDAAFDAVITDPPYGYNVDKTTPWDQPVSDIPLRDRARRSLPPAPWDGGLSGWRCMRSSARWRLSAWRRRCCRWRRCHDRPPARNPVQRAGAGAGGAGVFAGRHPGVWIGVDRRMRPYYDDGQVTLYHGDWRDVLPTMEDDSVDLVATDPPYPGLKGDMRLDRPREGWRAISAIGDIWGASLDWLPDAWRIARRGMFVFCSYHSVDAVARMLPHEARTALLTWHKRNSVPPTRNIPRLTTEFIWAFRKAPGLNWRALRSTMFDIPMICAGVTADERFIVDGTTHALHPTQKPLALMRTLLQVGGESVLDPFAGTGTTLRAAKDLGVRAIGIEIEERYCEVAVQRLAQAVLPLEVTQ